MTQLASQSCYRKLWKIEILWLHSQSSFIGRRNTVLQYDKAAVHAIRSLDHAVHFYCWRSSTFRFRPCWFLCGQEEMKRIWKRRDFQHQDILQFSQKKSYQIKCDIVLAISTSIVKKISHSNPLPDIQRTEMQPERKFCHSNTKNPTLTIMICKSSC